MDIFPRFCATCFDNASCLNTSRVSVQRCFKDRKGCGSFRCNINGYGVQLDAEGREGFVSVLLCVFQMLDPHANHMFHATISGSSMECRPGHIPSFPNPGTQ